MSALLSAIFIAIQNLFFYKTYIIISGQNYFYANIYIEPILGVAVALIQTEIKLIEL